MTTSPKLELKRGAEILEPTLSSAGFVFSIGSEGNSSGGSFCSGAFTKGNRRLELHVRGSLGLVAYSVGSQTMSHEDYLHALGIRGEYPGFSEDIEGGFIHLRNDLVKAGATFLTGSDSDFSTLVTANEISPRPKGFRALGNRK